jgi:hypothetical protein
LNQFAWEKVLWQLGITLLVSITIAAPLTAQSPVKIKNYEATIDTFEDGSSVFQLQGTASHLGNFSATGEVNLIPGLVEGSQIGSGVVVFEAANGDRLVGVANWILGPVREDSILETSVHFVWRDSVVLSDGTIVQNSGRFVNQRPPGLVVVDRYCCTTI